MEDVSGEMTPVIRRFRVHFDNLDCIGGSFDTFDQAKAFAEHWMNLEPYEYPEEDDEEEF